MKRLILILVFLVLPLSVVFGQAPTQVVINGDYVVLAGGTHTKPIYMVVNNSNTNAILSPSSGWIISENEFNMVQWNIGSGIGIYSVPFGYSTTEYLPLTLNISSAGAGPAGVIQFSTYHTLADQDTGITSVTGNPSDVTNLTPFTQPGNPSNTDNSYNIVDRFYIIDANTGYTTKPAAGNITFSYISGTTSPSEVMSPNILAENRFMAERFNSGSGTWSDWFGKGCTDAILSNIGTVQTGPVPSIDMYRSWTLWDNLTALPLTITSTNIICSGSSTGSATVTVSGGVIPYTYCWLPSGGSNSSASNLNAGTYTVTVKDNIGCISTIMAVITQPPLLITTSVTNSKHDGGTGGASITISGGISPYTYSWSPIGGTNSSATGLSAGVYTVTVVSATGCTNAVLVSINQPYLWADTTGITLKCDTLTKYAVSGWGNGGAASQSFLLAGQNGWVKALVSGISGKVAFGLTSINISVDYRTFDFAFLIQDKQLYIYQRGILTQKSGTVKCGDTLKIQRIGSTIQYMKNSIVLYTTIASTSILEAVASLYDNNSRIAGITWNFFQDMFIGGTVTSQTGIGALGSTTLISANGQPPPYQYMWNFVDYPYRNQFRPYLDSIINADSLSLDTTAIFNTYDSLRKSNQNNYQVSGINTISVMDSISVNGNTTTVDTMTINSAVGESITWINNIGLTINKAKSPRTVEYIPVDSLFTLTGDFPNLSQPVTCYVDSGTSLYKAPIYGEASANGWSSGEATSVNNLSDTTYGKVSFVVPNITTVEAAGLKVDTVADIPGYGDILYGFYFQRGTLYLISNGSITYYGTYRAGDMFSIENTYDTTASKHLQRILYKQENQLIAIAYINRSSAPQNGGALGSMGSSGSSGTIATSNINSNVNVNYSFKAAVHTVTTISSLSNIDIIGFFITPSATPIIVPESCGFPNTASISLSFSNVPATYSATSYSWAQGYTWSAGGTTTPSISNIAPGAYCVKVIFTSSVSSNPPIPAIYGPYDVGYKIYWANLGNAIAVAAKNTNSIKETSTLTKAGISGGNSSNATQCTYNGHIATGGTWVQFSVGNPQSWAKSFVAFGYSSNATSYNSNNIASGLLFLRSSKPYYVRQNLYPIYTIKATGYGNLAGFVAPSNTSGAPNNYLISNDNAAGTIRIYLNNNQVGNPINITPVNANYIIKATLQGAGNGAELDNGLCSFGCPDMNFSYATLTKTLDGSYYVSPYGNLSFRYDEEYVANGNTLPYTIYDMNHTVMYNGNLTAANYKDNYYSIDLTTINSLIYNGWYVLQVTNKKGEVTELRFKN